MFSKYNEQNKNTMGKGIDLNDIVLSRTSIDEYIKSPHFWFIKRVLGLNDNPGPGWPLNSQVDNMAKLMNDFHRENEKTPKLLEENELLLANIDELSSWRNINGMKYFDENRNVTICGGIDDLYVNSKGEYVIVDYKSTSTQKRILQQSDVFNNGEIYKRQLEIYKWILENKKLKMSSIGYLHYFNASTIRKDLDFSLEFEQTLVPIELDTSWIDSIIDEMLLVIKNNTCPPMNDKCDRCIYMTNYNYILDPKNEIEMKKINYSKKTVKQIKDDLISFYDYSEKELKKLKKDDLLDLIYEKINENDKKRDEIFDMLKSNIVF